MKTSAASPSKLLCLQTDTTQDLMAICYTYYAWYWPYIKSFAPSLTFLKFCVTVKSINQAPRDNLDWSYHKTKYFYTLQFLQRSHAEQTYCAPGSSPPLVVCWWHIPAAVPRMVSWVLGISIGLIVDTLAMVDRGTGCSGTLLFCCRLFFQVTERLVHWLVVVRADHLSGGSSHATCYWTLQQGRENQSVKHEHEGVELQISQATGNLNN